MISMKQSGKDSIQIALFGDKPVYYNPKFKQEEDEKADDSNLNAEEKDRMELLRFEFGARKTRVKQDLDKLKPTWFMLRRPNGHGDVFLPWMEKDKDGERLIHYICGKGGSGKTYLTRQLAEQYAKRMGLQVMIITPVKDHGIAGADLDIDKMVLFKSKSAGDAMEEVYQQAMIKFKHWKKDLSADEKIAHELAIRKLKPKNTKKRDVFEKSLVLQLLLKQLKNPGMLFIFDDNEAAEDVKKVEFLMNSLLLTGRHDNAYMICINHQANNGRKTRDIINESHMYTFFKPYSTYTEYFLKKYAQLDARQRNVVKHVLKDSRYCTIYKDQYILVGQHVIYKI